MRGAEADSCRCAASWVSVCYTALKGVTHVYSTLNGAVYWKFFCRPRKWGLSTLTSVKLTSRTSSKPNIHTISPFFVEMAFKMNVNTITLSQIARGICRNLTYTMRYPPDLAEVAIPKKYCRNHILSVVASSDFFTFAYSVLRKPEVFIVRMLPPPKVLILYLGS